MYTERLVQLWDELREKALVEDRAASRVYRALGRSAEGVRASFLPDEQAMELLIEVPANWYELHSMPDWRGLRARVLPDAIPPRATHQLSFVVIDSDATEVFVHFASDLVESLEGLEDASLRIERVVECINRWNQFFRQSGHRGLSESSQRGLYAELLFLGRVLDEGVRSTTAVGMWKGCERGYHDFDLGGITTEVKSTLSKEPRKVWINNERQLDDRNVRALYLNVVTLQVSEGGISLPDLVANIRQRLETSPGASVAFGHCLTAAGYLRAHEFKYAMGYVVRSTEVFLVNNTFPRIVDLPPGLGDLRYSVSVSACYGNSMEIDDLMKQLRECSNE